MKILTGHTSQATAYKVEDYPWGFRLRTSIFYWIETTPKHGDRFCSYTIDPKTGRECKPKKSTYSLIAFMFIDEKTGHVKWNGVNIYDTKEEVQKFVESMSGPDTLNAEQRKQYNAMTGIKTIEKDEFTGEIKKDFSIKWWKSAEGKRRELKITFDRPDGVSLKEMLQAMASVNQEYLKEVFEAETSNFLGDGAGIVRICVRGGVMLTTVSETTYKSYLASDAHAMNEI